VWRPAEVSWVRWPIRGRAGARALASRQINVRLPCPAGSERSWALSPYLRLSTFKALNQRPQRILNQLEQTSSIAFATNLIFPPTRATNRPNPPASQLADQRRSPGSRNNTPGTYIDCSLLSNATTNVRLSEFPVYTSRTPAPSFYPTIRPNNRISTTAHTTLCRLSIYRCV
jgi:hypothetical protein